MEGNKLLSCEGVGGILLGWERDIVLEFSKALKGETQNHYGP
jgi:hypothetical protein